MDGRDLIALGIEAGPRMGAVLAALLKQTLVDPTRNTKDELLRIAQVVWEEGGAGLTDEHDTVRRD